MLGPLTNTIQGVVNFTWPMLIISVVIMVSVRLTYILKNKIRFILYKELLMLVFAIYILCLFQVVTFQDSTTLAGNNFIPFHEIFRYKITSRLFIKNVIGNMIMFLPYGFFISYYINPRNISSILILTIIASLAIEFVQLLIGRVFDIDDILLNLIGGAIGYTIYNMMRKLGEKYPRILHSELLLNVISIIALLSLFTLLII